MEEFKINNFKKHNPNRSFPKFRKLTENETDQLRRKVLTVFLDKKEKGVFPLLDKIKHEGVLIENTCATSNAFDLARVLSLLPTQVTSPVYLNWYQFDVIDEIKLTDLCEYFDDIWYPSADDLDIFDGSLSWMLSISHSGNLSLLLPRKSPIQAVNGKKE